MEQKVEHEGDSDTNCCGCTYDDPQRTGKNPGRLENKKTSGDHPDNSIIKIVENTEKSPGDLRRFAVTPTPVRTHQETLVRKILRGVNSNNDNNNKSDIQTHLLIQIKNTDVFWLKRKK